MELSKVKRTSCMLVSALAIASSSALLPVLSSPNIALAASGEDDIMLASTEDFELDLDMSDDGTAAEGGKKKSDDSSVYVNIKSMTNRCRLYVDGTNKKNKESSWKNCTVNGYAKLRNTGKWCIQNKVYEKGYTYARVTGWANEGASHVKGKWSADSAGSYTAINA